MSKLQRYVLLICFFIFIIPGFLFSKEVTDSTEAGKGSCLGIKTGLYLSYFQSSSETGGPHGYILTVIDENKFKPGFSVGLFLDFNSKRHVSIQPEINYIWFRHNIKYSEWYKGSPVGNTTNTEYELSCSVIQFCLLPTLALGNNRNVNILAGPFIRIPLFAQYKGSIKGEDALHGGVGTIVGLNVNTPVNSGFLCFEIRAGADISNIMTTPKPIKETSVALSLSYLFRLKKY
jgi:hypothetical protein